MPQITFNERLLTLTTDSRAAGHAIVTPQKLAEAIEDFAAGKDPGRSLAIASNLDWKKLFTVWPTGGGVVRNMEGKYLLIRRLGWWDLPKGKLDPGESAEAAALREVGEETGVTGLRIVRPLTVTYHSYEEKGRRILKENHWYLMETDFTGRLSPQTEEDITECIWADESGLRERWFGMYKAVQEVLTAALAR
ncbi:MAG: NUDIX domain-containing protein [Chitinophagaceae bacterium]|nr:MAG: NUDIX domain-containing protein [Chitinophagaceae bacterium]